MAVEVFGDLDEVALIECIADGLANRDADVIPFPEREEDAPEGTPSH